MQFYQYKHLESEYPTVGAIISQANPIITPVMTENVQGKIVPIKSREGKTKSQVVLEYSYQDWNEFASITNWERIQIMYTTETQQLVNEDRYNNKLFEDIEVPVGTLLYIPQDEIQLEAYFARDKTVVEHSTFAGFVAQDCKSLFEKEGYKQVVEYKNGSLTTNNLSYEVFMWVKSLGVGGADGAWMNVSSFVSSIQTNVGENGGNFSISLMPIVGELTVDNEFGESVWSISKAHSKGGGFYTAHMVDTPFFGKVLGNNDLVYIRFENLIGDKGFSKDLILSASDIPKRDWDMIGLIDDVSVSKSAAGNSVGVSVTGRDLIKAFIEDYTVFYPVAGAKTIFTDANDESKLIKRLYGELYAFQSFVRNSVPDCMRFILNQMSYTGFVSNQAFAGYKDSDVSKINRQSTGVKQLGLPELSPLPTGTPSFPKFPGVGLLGTKVRGSKYAQDFGFGKTLTLPTKVPKIFPSADQLKLMLKFTPASGLSFTRPTPPLPAIKVAAEPSDGIWKIVRIVCDEGTTFRHVVDSSISTAQGPLINFVRKVVQSPLLEFITDTYGKFFVGVIRKPPFDEAGQYALLKKDVATEETIDDSKIYHSSASVRALVPAMKGVPIGDKDTDIPLHGVLKEVTIGGSKFGPLVLEIKGNEVLSENLSWETKVYSWYTFNPRANLLGTDVATALAYIGAVKFDEYVDVWGSKPYQVDSNYADIFNAEDRNSKITNNLMYYQILQDFKYVIDTNAYLPFTRKGTITINGDRRFKRGLYIYYWPTDEVFYVTNVQNSRSINMGGMARTTTLTVERGMLSDHIEKYHQIISTPIDTPVTGDDLVPKIISQWKVNPEIFKFFLQRRQW